MRIQITHKTAYQFDPPARGLTQVLRLEPREASNQQVRSWRIETGGDAFLRRAHDSFGNIVHTLQADGPLDAFDVTASGEIHTEDTNGIIGGTFEPLPLGLFLRDTGKTETTNEMCAFAADHMEGRAPLDGLHRLMGGLKDQMTYETGKTTMATTAAEAFEARHGVCQDFSHIFIACARSQGTPARYVSGYLHEDPHQDSQSQSQDVQAQSQQSGSAADETGAEPATHAWSEAFVDGLGWVAFDTTHNVCPTDHYVRVAVGLDALDAAPVRGVRQGTTAETMTVDLRVMGSGFGRS